MTVNQMSKAIKNRKNLPFRLLTIIFSTLLLSLLIPLHISAASSGTFESLNLFPTITSIGVTAAFSGSAGESAAVQYKKSSDSDWRAGMSLTPDTDTGTSFTNQWRGVVLWCQPGTSYDVKVTINNSGGESVLEALR